MRALYRYGILDDEGKVVRWVYDKPSNAYRFIRTKIVVEPPVNWSNFEPALF